jgi:phosphoglucosamine mutase
LGAEPNGLNVNENCGSTHIENLCHLVKEKHLDFGFAFDGDADRCIAVDEKGNVVDGDSILYILGKRLKSRGVLNENTIVATVMSNSGLVKSLSDMGVKCIQTDVGDRFVYECMQKGDYTLGGEQSGHIIIKKYATTGDGILTAIMMAEEVCDRNLPMSKLSEGMLIYPQYSRSIRVKDKEAVTTDVFVQAEVKNVSVLIGDGGRVLLRKSGTEPVVRIMVECVSKEKCTEYADMIEEVIFKRGHFVE